MNSYRPAPSSNIWLTTLKIVILILALYFSAIILGRIFTWIFAITFFLIKIAVFIIVGFFLLHLFLKLLFRFDLWKFIFGSRFSH
ncbi:hypothetical protein AusDCA_1954 [Desulfitobacterium sp. AusDCA]